MMREWRALRLLTACLMSFPLFFVTCAREGPPVGAESSDFALSEVSVSIQEMEAALATLEAIHVQSVEKKIATLSGEELQIAMTWAEQAGMPVDKVAVSFSRRGVVRSLSAWEASWPSGLPVSASADEMAAAFLGKWSALFQHNAPEFEVAGSGAAPGDFDHVGLRQLHQGLPIFGSHVVVHLTGQTGIRGFNGLVVPSWALPSSAPLVSASQAQAVAEGLMVEAGPITHLGTAVLGVFDPEMMLDTSADAVLAYAVDVGTISSAQTVFVNASSGDLLHVKDLVSGAEQKKLYWLDHTFLPPGTFVCEDPSCDCSEDYPGTVEDVCALTHDVYSYYSDRFGRDMWDNDPNSPNHRMQASADYGPVGSMESYWNTLLDQTYFGDAGVCDGQVAHEWTHAVDHATDGSGNDVQTKFLEEGFSDVMGEFFEKYVTGSADWLVTSGSPACSTVLRNLEDPPEEEFLFFGPYPDHWSNFEAQDGWGHYNGTIIGKGGYLLGRESSQGEENHWGRGVTGIGALDAEQIFYNVLVWRLSNNADMTEFRNDMRDSARALFGYTSTQFTQTKNMTESLGIFSSDYAAGLSSDRAVQVEFFSVNGQQRWWVFFKNGTSTRFHYVYRTCPLWGRCSWSSPATLGLTQHSPGATPYFGDLWAFYVDASSGDIKWRKIDGAGNVSSPATQGWSTDSGVTATSCGNFLYVFWKAPGEWEQPLKYARYHSAVGWSPVWSVPSASASDFGPTATCENGTNVWIAYRRLEGSEERVFVRKLDATLSWGAELMVPNSVASESPSIDYYRNRLHVGSTVSSASLAYYASCELPCSSGIDWTRWVAQDGASDAYLALDSSGAADGNLYIWHRGAGSTTLYWRWKDSE